MHQQQVVPGHFVHRDKIANGLLESLKCLVMVEVADVLADESLAINYQRYRVLQVGPDGEQRPLHRQRGYGARSISARAPQNNRTEAAHTRH